MNIVFLGTADFAVPCLEILHQEGFQIAGVGTQPDRPSGRGKKINFNPIKKTALSLGLNIMQPEKIKAGNAIKEIASLKPDLLVVVAYGQLLPKELLELAPFGCINVHASLLPKYRGGAPIHRAIIAGEKETGVTTMYVSEALDAGDIILQKKIEIGSELTVGELHDGLAIMGGKLLLETVEKISMGTAPRIPQDHTKATYASLLTRKDEEINWKQDAQDIVNLIRGMDPWPGASTRWKGMNLKIWQGKVELLEKKVIIPGEVIGADQQGVLIAAGDGKGVLIKELQLQGKKRLSAREFLNGNQMVLGEKLE